MIKRMDDEKFEKLRKYTIQGKSSIGDEANRARQSEQHLKAQILELFDYLVQNFPKDMFNENAHSACKTAVEVMENLRTSINLHNKLDELFKEETDILKLDRKKLIDLVRRLKSICLQ